MAEATSIVEDVADANLIFLGTSAGVFVSMNRGESWARFQGDMAPAPVTDLVVHPREGDLVVGTYGRGVWATNIVPLRGFTPAVLSSDAALLPIRAFAERNEGALGNYRLLGDRYPATPNEPNATVIAYYLKQSPPGPATAEGPPQGGRGGPAVPRCVADGGDGRHQYLTIADSSGNVVCTLVPDSRVGLNQVIRNLIMYAPRPEAGRGGRGAFGGPPAAAGEYTFTLHAGAKAYVQKARLISREPAR